MKNYLVFDWGGTYLKYALMDGETRILEKGKVPSPKKTDTKEVFMKTIDEIVSRCPQTDGIAISSPGILNSDTGVIDVVAVFPYLSGCNIREELQERYHVPVSLENDGKCAALAELWKGNLQGCRDGAVMIIGTAIGGGIILDGRLRRGRHYSAGEFSEMCFDIYRPERKESYCSALGAAGLITRVAAALGKDPAEMSGEEAFACINEGNEAALQALREYTDLFALQICSLNILLDLEKVCIGGGISQQPELIRSLRLSMEGLKDVQLDMKNGLELPLCEVDVCRFHNDANLIGALYHLIYES
ncbi:MAG: ROK family protein [Solobacterium sp.]|nr:ROK family protein [Solobacterium sp.]